MRALILDDEYTAVEYLETLLQRHCPDVKSIVATTSVQEALKHINEGEIDIFFSDIEMDEMSGLELVFSLQEGKAPPVVFTTAYNQYAIKAFRASAVDYLLKPIDPKELVEAVERVKTGNRALQDERLSNLINDLSDPLDKRFAIADGSNYHLVKASEIIKAEGSGNYTTFYLLGDHKLEASKGLKHFTKMLTPDMGFIRPHQSHLVNMEHTIKYSKTDGGELFLKEGHRAPVSHRLKKQVQEALGLT